MAAAASLADDHTREEVGRLRDEFVELNAERMQYMQAFERTKRTNESVIVKLRDENKHLKQQVAEMQSETYAGMDSALSEAEQDRLTGEVTLWRSKQDGLSHTVKQLGAQYSKLREEFMALHRQRSTAIDTPEMRTVRSLENRLDKAMLKFNEAQSIRKTYEQIVKRLREERMGFDQQLGALEATVDAKRKDLTELRGLATEAEKAKSAAIDAMKTVALQQKTEAEKRIKSLRAKEEAALKQARASRSERRRAVRQHSDHDMTADEEEALRQDVMANLQAIEDMASHEAQSLSKVHLYEEAFRAIQDVTGVRDENEVIQRMSTQLEQLSHLKGVSKDNAEHVSALARDVAFERENVEHVKFGGAGARVGGKQAQDELELQVAEASTRRSKASAKFNHLSGILTELKTGIEHLADTLAPAVAQLRIEQSGSATAYQLQRDRKQGTPVEQDRGVVDTLRGVEGATLGVLRHIDSLKGQLQAGIIPADQLTGPGSFSSAGAASRPAGGDEAASHGSGEAASAAPSARRGRLDGSIDTFLATNLTEGDISQMNTRQLNVRVGAQRGGMDGAAGSGGMPVGQVLSSDDEGEEDADSDEDTGVLSRDALKRQAQRSALAASRRG